MAFALDLICHFFDSMSDIIHFDADRLISTDVSMENTHAMNLEQNDFIPWKRGISL